MADSSPFKGMKKLIYAALKIIIVIIILLTLILVSGSVYLQTSAGSEFFKNLVQVQIEKNIPLKVDIGRLDTNLFNRVNAREIAIYNMEGSNAPRLLFIENLQIDYNIANFLSGQVYLDSCLINHVRFFVSRDEKGTFRLPFPGTDSLSQNTGHPFALPFNVLYTDIKDLDIRYEDRQIPLHIVCSNLQTRASRAPAEDKYKFEISIDSCRLTQDGTSFNISNIFLKGALEETFELQIDTMRAFTSDLYFSGNISLGTKSAAGQIQISGNPRTLLTTFQDGFIAEICDGFIQANLDLVLKDYRSEPEIYWSLRFPELLTDNLTVKDLSCSGKWQADTLILADLSLRLFNGLVSAAGSVMTDSSLMHHLRLSVRDVNLSAFLAKWLDRKELSFPSLNLDLAMDSYGRFSSLSSLEAQGRLTVTSDTDTILDPLLGFSDSRLSIRSAQQPIDINSDIGLSEEGYSGNGVIELTQLQTLLPYRDHHQLNGQLHISHDITGTWSAVDLTAKIHGEGFVWDGIPFLDSLYVSLEMNNGSTIIDSSYFCGNYIDLHRTGQLFGIQNVQGYADYSASVGGLLTNPASDFHASLNNVSYGPAAIKQADLDLDIRNQKINISRLELKTDSLLITAGGVLDYRVGMAELDFSFSHDNHSSSDHIAATAEFISWKDFSISAVSPHFSLKYLNEFLSESPISEGAVKWELDLARHDDRVTANLPFAIKGLRLANVVIDSAYGRFRLNDNILFTDSLLIAAGKHHTFINTCIELDKNKSGLYRMDLKNNTKGTVTGDNFDLRLLNNFIENTAAVAGQVSFNLAWDGPLINPNLTGSLHLSDGSIQPVNSSVSFSGMQGTISFADSAVQINDFTGIFEDIPFSVDLSINQPDTNSLKMISHLSAGGDSFFTAGAILRNNFLDAYLESKNADISVIQPIFPELQNIRGTLTSEIGVKGEIGNPRLEGAVRLSGVSFKSSFLDMPVKDGHVSIHLLDNRISLDSASLKTGQGQIFAKGNMISDNTDIRDLDLYVRASDLLFSEPHIYSLKLNTADLNLKSQQQGYKLGGMLHLGNSKYSRDFFTTDLWKILIARTESVLEGPSEEPMDLMMIMQDNPLVFTKIPEFAKNIEFDLRVQNSDSLWIENNIANICLKPDLSLQGNYETPLINGRITVRDGGKLIFLDREFEVTTGIIDFADAERVNPIIRLVAKSELSGTAAANTDEVLYKIMLNLSGPLDDFDYALTSDPPLEEADIISLLTLGITYEQLQASENVDSIIKERSAVLATRELSNQLNYLTEDWLGETFDLDYIGIEGNIFDPGQTRVALRKKWSDRVEISYSTSVGKIDRQIFSARLKLYKVLYLEGLTDQQEESAIDLKFRLKFR